LKLLDSDQSLHITNMLSNWGKIYQLFTDLYSLSV
jgi:hypothetical protein